MIWKPESNPKTLQTIIDLWYRIIFLNFEEEKKDWLIDWLVDWLIDWLIDNGLRFILSIFTDCFTVYDLNGDGYISREEMFQLLKSSLIKQPTEEDPDEGVKELVELSLKKMVCMVNIWKSCTPEKWL